jgi:hypothetical protein
MTSFTAKRLRVRLILAGTNAVFPGTNNNTLELSELRMSAKVQAVARLTTQADIRIYGMLQADMNALTVAWANPPVVLDHLVILEANNTGRDDGWVQVFKGTIIEAQPDYRAAPDVSFNLLAVTGYFVKINAAEPTSYEFQVDIGVAAADIIERMGEPWAYVDGGADGVLSNPYFYGTLWDQLTQACVAAKADFYIQGDEILVVPAGQPRPSAPSVILSPGSGLIGYPMFERSGLLVNALFDPAFLCGTPLDIQSEVPNASGRWYPYAMSHTLETKVPRGAWFSQLQCLRVIV